MEQKWKIITDSKSTMIITDSAYLEAEDRIIYKGVKISFEGDILMGEEDVLYTIKSREDMYNKDSTTTQ